MPRKKRISKTQKNNKSKKEKEAEFLEIVKNHRLFPEARILNEKEVEELLNKYKIKKEHLPKIFEKDPLVKVLGAKKGDVIEIKRKSLITGESIYYRLVI